jgi:hypothetical protein
MTNGTSANTQRAGKRSSRLSLVELGFTRKLPLPIKILSQSVRFRRKTGKPRHKGETFSALFPALAIVLVAGQWFTALRALKAHTYPGHDNE